MKEDIIRDIALAARKGDLAGVNSAIDLLATHPRDQQRIIEARALADRRSGLVAPLPQLAEDPLIGIAAENAAKPLYPGFAHLPQYQRGTAA